MQSLPIAAVEERARLYCKAKVARVWHCHDELLLPAHKKDVRETQPAEVVRQWCV